MWGDTRSDRRPEAVRAAGVDDVALVGALQHRQEGAGAVIYATPADVECPFPLVAAVGDHAAAATDAGVVEQQMNLVRAVALCDLVAKSLHLRGVGHVGKVSGDAGPAAVPLPRRAAASPSFPALRRRTSRRCRLPPRAGGRARAPYPSRRRTPRLGYIEFDPEHPEIAATVRGR